MQIHFCSFRNRHYEIRRSTKQRLHLPTVCAKHVATPLTLSKVCHNLSSHGERERRDRRPVSREAFRSTLFPSHKFPIHLNTPSKPFLITHKLTPAPFLKTATSPASAPLQTASSKPKTTPPSKLASAKSTRRAATPVRTRSTHSVASYAAALRATIA